MSLNPKTRILALDMAETFGWAFADRGQIMASGWGCLNSESRTERMYRARVEVDDLICKLHPTSVVYERPFARGLHATRSLWGLAGVVEGLCHERGLPVLDEKPTVLKKWATGKGNATKDEMVGAANDGRGAWLDPYHPWVDSDDEADAVLLARYAWEKMETG